MVEQSRGKGEPGAADPEEEVQQEMDNVKTNRALHAMTAHCLRYETELATIAAVITELIVQHGEVSDLLKLKPEEKDRVRRALNQQLAEVNSMTRMQCELAKKTKNIQDLVRKNLNAYIRLHIYR